MTTPGDRDPVRYGYAALILVACVASLLNAARGPIHDVDVYWHALIGQNILAGSSIADAARGWTFDTVDDSTWISGQWLFEVSLAASVNLMGWHSLVLWRVVSTALILGVLAFTTLRGRHVRGAVWPFLLAASMATLATQERSQQVTFVLAPLVGWWAARLLRSGQTPRWWVVVPLCAVWSNVHGGWVLLPAVLGLAALGRLLDHGWHDSAARRGLLLVGLALLAAAVSPAGLANITSFLRFRSDAAPVTEWQPVVVWSQDAIPLVLFVLLIVVSWARGAQRPSRGELVLVLLVLAFGFTAWRNETPAALLLAPLAADIVCDAWGLKPEPAHRSGPWWRAPKLLALGAAGVVVLGLALGVAWSQSPIDPAQVPSRLLASLHATSSPQRVLNTYNLGGATLLFAGPPPAITVGIDGRTDLYGSSYITDYQLTLLTASPGWERLLDGLAPTAALLDHRQALVNVLISERGWVVVGTEGDFVLLHSPDAIGWPAT